MNKKRSQLTIRETLANGEWISEPHIVKNEFFTHFKKQFSRIQAPSICFDFTFPTCLSLDHVQDLEHTVTYEEVKRAVWDCGTNKSPGPDGFSFEFCRKYWTTIDDDAFQVVRDFFVNGHFPRGYNNNIQTLLSVLRCFYLASGLKINLHKSKLMRLGVSSNVVAAAASLIGCYILTAHFNYLGVKVGSNMLRITSWDDVISKWVWRFLTDGSSLWTRFIKVIFGNKGALDTHKLIPRRSPWQDVILAIHSLQSKEEVALKVLYKRLYALEMCKSISVAEKMGHPSLSHSFRRIPRGSQEFSVKSSRILIDNTILPKAEVPTRWLRVVPIK
nr:RNA-directed DNA polymerase, eukaryota [Tanacetum cinerariifolium]